MDEELKKYRDYLIQTVSRLNEYFDKLAITLAGGALAFSIAFLKDFIGSKEVVCINTLLYSWLFFTSSIAVMLLSLIFGIAANKKAIKQIDDDQIYSKRPGGKFSIASTWLHYSVIFFLVGGLILTIIFVNSNLENKNDRRQASKQTATAQTTAATSKATRPPNTTERK